VKETEVHENLEADDMIFYHSLRADLDSFEKETTTADHTLHPGLFKKPPLVSNAS
jgi:hypothetical protein